MKITLQSLTKKFPARSKSENEVIAVNNVDLEIHDGELLGLLGPSGCGKSTVLNMICGLYKPSYGKIFFGDDDVTALGPEKRGVGMVFQSYALYPHLTVLQNIMFPLENLKGPQKLSREEMQKRAHEAMKLVQISELEGRRPSELSGGQQQRVAIARAIVKRPKVLLLDEPLSNLDARLRMQTREEIRRIQRETGITTVFVTHDQEEAMSISDRIALMKCGVIQQLDKPQTIYDDPANLFISEFLGTPRINTFNGRIKNGKLYIGDDAVFDAHGSHDRELVVGVRPEGFIPCDNGKLKCGLSGIEVMGRDVSILADSNASRNRGIRAIVSAQTQVDTSLENIAFDLVRDKTFLFDAQSGERVRLDLTDGGSNG